jgi:GH35 family endo-1,4-beta-xylanase
MDFDMRSRLQRRMAFLLVLLLLIPGGFAAPAAAVEDPGGGIVWSQDAEDGGTGQEQMEDVTPPDAEPGEPDESVIIREDFESGIGGWVRRFGADGIEVTDQDNHTPGGRQSLQTTVSAQYDGALLDVRGRLERGYQYELSVWAKMAENQEATVLRISVHNGQNSYVNVSPDVQVTSQGWVKLTGIYTQNAEPGDILSAYVEVAMNYGEARTFLLDDFEVRVVGRPGLPNPDFSLPSLKDVYEDYFPIGGIMNPWDFEQDERLQMMKKHYSLLTAENFMKPEYAYRSGTREFDLAGMLSLVEQARANGFKVHGHVLVWHAQSPNWLHTQVDENGNPLRDENGNVLYLDRETALENLRTHIRTVVETIGDRVISWDVVNEAMNDNPPNPTDWRDSLRRSGWYYAIGPDYLYEAFKAAREVIDEHGWDIELYYNDYNDDNQNKATAIAEMVRELNERYAEETGSDKKLVDGIGMQAHYNLNTNPANVRASIERIIGLGVKVGITELDVMAGTNNVLTEDEAIRQGQLYAQLFQLYKEYADHITRVTFWGLDDGSSWRSANSPLLFDSRFQAKPAYYAVVDPDQFLEDHPPASREALQAKAAYGTPVIDGEEDDVWSKAEELPIARYQTAHNGAKGTARVLWDEDNLYVLIQVEDTELDRSSTVAHEQDSIEVFVDETNSKAASYGPGVGQYRVNYENEPSFNPGNISEGFESAVAVNGTNYTVEVKIPFKTIEPSEHHKIGFDVQINDAQGGSRRSVANWNDLSGQGWQDPSVFGVLTLVKQPPGEPEEPGEPNRNVIIREDFESGIGGWVRRFGPGGIEVTDQDNHTPGGRQSLKTTVSAQYDGALLDVRGKLEQDRQYELSVWAKMAEGQEATVLRISVHNGQNRYVNVSPDTEVTDREWVKLRGVYTQSEEPGDILSAYVEAAQNQDWPRTFLLDDFELRLVDTAEPEPGPDPEPEPGPGPGPGGGYVYVPIPAPELTVREDGSVTIKPTVKDGVAEASLSGNALSDALEKTGSDASGGKTAIVEIETEDADAVEVALPAESLGGGESFVIRLKTPLGEIAVPSNMLEGLDVEGETVVLSIAYVDVRELDEDVRDRIGDRPVISLNVLAGGEPVAWNNPDAPVTVSVPYEPTEDERANPDRIVVWYIDGEGNATVVPNGRYDAATGAVVFRTTHFSTYAIAYADAVFHDIARAAWAKKAIEAMASRDLLAGAGGSAFRPRDPVSRAEFAALLVRLLELQGAGEADGIFSDVSGTHAFLTELAIANRLGIIRGDADGRFHPDAPVTRQDMMVMVDRALAAAGKPLPAGGSLDKFSDADAVAGYARSSAEKLVAAGIVQGSGGRLAPGSALTRAEAAVILYRIWSH